MTLTDILTALSDAIPEAQLIFTADGQAIHAGYHVTEFQVAQIRSMTCGGKTDAWDEARVQIMDGYGSQDPMRVDRFLHIAKLVQQRFPEMAALPLSVAFAPKNRGLSIYQPGSLQVEGATVTLPLISDQAQCKAMMTTSCCGTGAEACCAA